jgi:hypothetical protein
MRNILYLILLLTITIVSCSKKDIDKKSDEKLVVFPRSDIKAVIDSFILFNNKELVYEIYVDKIGRKDYDIILYSGERPLIENGYPIMKTNISGVVFDIYSGIEHFFKDSSNSQDSIGYESLPDDVPKGNSWIISERKGVLNTYKDAWIFPFQTSERIEFEIPEVEE